MSPYFNIPEGSNFVFRRLGDLGLTDLRVVYYLLRVYKTCQKQGWDDRKLRGEVFNFLCKIGYDPNSKKALELLEKRESRVKNGD